MVHQKKGPMKILNRIIREDHELLRKHPDLKKQESSFAHFSMTKSI